MRRASEGVEATAPPARPEGEPTRRRWRLDSISGRSRSVLMAVAIVFFIGAGAYAIRDFPSDAISHARWWLLAIVCITGPLATVALNGAEYIAQARIVGVEVAFLEGVRVSIVATAANMLPIPGSALVRTQALATSGSGYKKATATTFTVGAAWMGSTATLAADPRAGDGNDRGGRRGRRDRARLPRRLVRVVRRAQPPTGVGDMFGRILAIEAGAAIVGALRFFGILYALGIDISAPQAMALALASVIASASGIFPAGIGIREALAGAIGAIVGLPAASGVAAAATDRVAGLFVLAVLTAFLMWHNRTAAKTAPNPTPTTTTTGP